MAFEIFLLLPWYFTSRVLQKRFNCMIPDLPQTVNVSPLSGVFPQAMKTAAIKPLLRKNNRDTSVMNNYRPISNQTNFKKNHWKWCISTAEQLLNDEWLFWCLPIRISTTSHHSTETTLVKGQGWKRWEGYDPSQGVIYFHPKHSVS